MHQESIAYIPLHARDGSVKAYAIVDAADFEWAQHYNWHMNPNGYAQRCEHVKNSGKQGKTVSFLLHRELFGLSKFDRWLDHINRNRLDNRRSNLRFIDGRGNALNSKFRSSNTSGYRGVAYQRRSNKISKYMAQIRIDGKQKTLGRFKTAEEAARAYDVAAAAHYGEYAQLNFPSDAQ